MGFVFNNGWITLRFIVFRCVGHPFCRSSFYRSDRVWKMGYLGYCVLRVYCTYSNGYQGLSPCRAKERATLCHIFHCSTDSARFFCFSFLPSNYEYWLGLGAAVLVYTSEVGWVNCFLFTGATKDLGSRFPQLKTCRNYRRSFRYNRQFSQSLPTIS